MLVPDNQRKSNHVVSMYLATCGANGHLLGSDEKEIIYLVFGIIDIQNKEVSDQKNNKKNFLNLHSTLKNLSCKDITSERINIRN